MIHMTHMMFPPPSVADTQDTVTSKAYREYEGAGSVSRIFEYHRKAGLNECGEVPVFIKPEEEKKKKRIN